MACMNDLQQQIELLLSRLEDLRRKQGEFQQEIDRLQTEIRNLQSSKFTTPEKPPSTVATTEELKQSTGESSTVPDIQPEGTADLTKKTISKPGWLERAGLKSDLEKFIGENLINKIGIVITVIGVGIGAKYAIDNQLISPLTRIILGYLLGLGFLVTAIRLKSSYETFSAVLLSGAMAILYFITYIAFSFYFLISQPLAFSLMVFFTIFTVLAALRYNKQVIAQIGLVGAYAVPFLLGGRSEQAVLLFSYISILNTGILIIAFKKYWKPLYISSFIFTWMIYYSWYLSQYQVERHFFLALSFLSLFFSIFYAAFLSYKLIQKEQFNRGDIILLLLNSFIFYGLGYSIWTGHTLGIHVLGLFTIFNALIHFLVSLLIKRIKLADRNLFNFILGLVLVFIAIAIPVQLNGNWVTILWAAQALVLLWLGRTRKIPVFEILSYPIMLFAFVSYIHDVIILSDYFSTATANLYTPVLNRNFLTSASLIISFSFINILFFKTDPGYPLAIEKNFFKAQKYLIPAMLLFVSYYAFYVEIQNYWNLQLASSTIQITKESNEILIQNDDINRFKIIWLFNYSMVYMMALAWLNIRKLRDLQLAWFNLGAGCYLIFIFLANGLFTLAALRHSYLAQTLSEYYHQGVFNILIRYVSLLLLGGLLYSFYRYIKQDFIRTDMHVAWDFLFHICLLWVASHELIHWIDLLHFSQSYKLGLSLLWGFYSLILIILGIKQKKKYLRISAIVLFSITLLKIFLYDIAYLSTLSKTILFILSGILLLIISFFYHKYKHLMYEEQNSEN